MARKTRNVYAPQHDDSWLVDVADIITKPTHRLNFFVNSERNDINVKIEYDDLKTIETITDDYGNYQKARAFYESLYAFINEIPGNVKLEVNRTNVAYLFSEMQTEDRPNAKRLRELLKSRNIKLTLKQK